MKYGYRKTTYERRGGGMVNHKHTTIEPILPISAWITIGFCIFAIRYLWWLIPIIIIVCICCCSNKEDKNIKEDNFKIKKEQIEIGDILIRYKEGFGTLAIDFKLDIDMNEEELKHLSSILTQMNDIIIPSINEKYKI